MYVCMCVCMYLYIYVFMYVGRWVGRYVCMLPRPPVGWGGCSMHVPT